MHRRPESAIRNPPSAILRITFATFGSWPLATIRPSGRVPQRELAERFDDVLLVLVAVEVVPLDVQDAGDPGLEVLEAAVVFAGLGDEQLAVAAAGGAAQLRAVGPDDEVHVEAGLLEAVDQPAGGGALAVGAADGDAVEGIHQLAEELGVLVDVTAPLAGQLQLRIALADRRRDHDGVRARAEVLGAVADVNIGAQAVQPRGDRPARLVGTGDERLLLQQEPGQAAHADAAGPNEMVSCACDFGSIHSLHNLIPMGRFDYHRMSLREFGPQYQCGSLHPFVKQRAIHGKNIGTV